MYSSNSQKQLYFFKYLQLMDSLYLILKIQEQERFIFQILGVCLLSFLKKKMINQDSFSEEVHYSLGDVVWAKITGYPWWPAKITQLPETTTELYRIDFFNDCTHAYLPIDKLEPYTGRRESCNLKKIMQKMLKKAIIDADQVIASFSISNGAMLSTCSLSRVMQQQLLGEVAGLGALIQENQNHLSKQSDLTVLKNIVQQILVEKQQIQISQQAIEKTNSQKDLQNDNTKQIQKIDIDRIVKKYNINRVYKILNLQTQKSKRLSIKKRNNYNYQQKHIKRQTYNDKQKQKLLCKRINNYLSNILNVDININLAKQIISYQQQQKAQRLSKLLKWLTNSSQECILKYYSFWSSLEEQTQKIDSPTSS